MSGWKSLFGRTGTLLLAFIATVAPASARNAVRWNYLNLPEAGGTGETVELLASVTNQGDAAWTGDHYIEIRDGSGAHLDYVSLAGTAPGATRAIALPLRLPARRGAYTYFFTALHHGVEYFGPAESRTFDVPLEPARRPTLRLDASSFPAGAGRRGVALSETQVGDVLSLSSTWTLSAENGWRHNLLVRRPAITSAVALAPEDGSGLKENADVWNRDGWGNPFTDRGAYDASVAGAAAADLGNREPFIHPLAAGQRGSTRTCDLVLDAPGTWLFRAEIVDAAGRAIAASATTELNVAPAALAGDVQNITYPYGRSDRFVGVFWNAGQAHRLWSTWRAVHDRTYPATWAVNWQLMWQPSPYFRTGGGWSRGDPAPESPWQPFWSAHQVYPIIPDGRGGSLLTHDITSLAFAERAAVRLMDVGVDFVAVDYTNQFLEVREDVLPAVNNLALAFQNVALRSQSGQRVKLTAMVPANIESGDWAGSGGFVSSAIARFNAKLTILYQRYARFESAWFHLEDDNRVRKPLLLLWVGASGEAEPNGTLARTKLALLRLADGRALTDVFTVRWVGAFLGQNRRFVTGAEWTVWTGERTLTGKYARPKLWSYREDHPAVATVMPGATGALPAVEAITVQPATADRDRFGRAWQMNWPAGQGFHYETPAGGEAVPLAGYGRAWAEALVTARALNPRILLTTWLEFGSENDEPRPELSVTVMDNNKFGTHFGDVFKQAVRLFKYQEPSAWIEAITVADTSHALASVTAGALPVLRTDQSVRLHGWVTPNVATTFAGGSVKVFIDDTLRGTAVIGGASSNATHWYYDLALAGLAPGTHRVKVLAEDGRGGAALAGVQFRAAPPTNALAIAVGEAR